MKRCSKCGAEKALSEFHRDAQKRDGLRPDCKTCFDGNVWNRADPKRRREYGAKWQRENRNKTYMHRRRGAWRRQGMDPDVAQATLAMHDGACDLCGTESPGGTGWHVEHSHATGRIRGIVCGACNMGLGMVDRVGTKRIEDYLNANHRKEM